MRETSNSILIIVNYQGQLSTRLLELWSNQKTNGKLILFFGIVLFQFSRMDQIQKRAQLIRYSLMIWIHPWLSSCPIYVQFLRCKYMHSIETCKFCFWTSIFDIYVHILAVVITGPDKPPSSGVVMGSRSSGHKGNRICNDHTRMLWNYR